MVAHSQLTGADLHEPKGVATAGANTVYVADGSSSGAWEKISADSVDTTTVLNLNRSTQNRTMPDIGTAGSVYMPMSRPCRVEGIAVTIDVATATAATVITFRNDAGNSMGTITIPSGSAAGYVGTLVPTTNNTFLTSTKLQIESDGGTSTTTPMTVALNLVWT